MNQKLLMTYFGAFPGVSSNPTCLVAELTRDRLRELDPELEIELRELPVSFAESSRVLPQLLEEIQPTAVIATGVAVGRSRVSLERVAINCDETSVPDNSGALAQAKPIRVKGPAAFFSRLPLHDILAAAQQAQLPVEISNTAGTYVCNHVFYELMFMAACEVPAGFIHIPAVKTGSSSERMQAHRDAAGIAGLSLTRLPVEQVVDAMVLAVLLTLRKHDRKGAVTGSSHRGTKNDTDFS